MAKKSSVEKNNRRAKRANSAFASRAALKAIIMDRDLPAEDRFKASVKLAAMPRNAAKIRVKSRCVLTGRSHAVYRKFGLSRVIFRDLCSEGMIPGVTKSSW